MGEMPILTDMKKTCVHISVQKPSQPYQYLHWDSNLFLLAKYSVPPPWNIGQEWSGQANWHYNKKMSILNKPCLDVVSLHGP